MKANYCESVHRTKRWTTREVQVGSVGVGGANPVRIQSMTTSSTRDVDATVEQIIRLAEAGCDIARVTVQGMKEAEACEQIKNLLLKRGYMIPLVADIHFFPKAAMRVVEYVDKVRVNPGNYVDKRATFRVIEYDDDTYARELERLEEKFSPLVTRCRELGRAMRIGTNHGSLSDRVLNRFGDTAEGMVESALEFAYVCRKYDFHDIIFSMKASNPQVMIRAYRLLVAKMKELGWNYPLHLGVTEAGDGEDGRIKSAMGIGALLLDGLGDTIRVSLTEDPWREIDPCQRLRSFAQLTEGTGVDPFEEKYRAINEIRRREVQLPRDISVHRDGTVMLKMEPHELENERLFDWLNCHVENGQIKLKRSSVDSVVVNGPIPAYRATQLHELGVSVIAPDGEIALKTLSELRGRHEMQQQTARFALTAAPAKKQPTVAWVRDEDSKQWDILKETQPSVILLGPSQNRVHASRRFFEWLQEQKLQIPVILNFRYDCGPEDFVIRASAECGALLCDGLGDGVCLDGPYSKLLLHSVSFTLLQAARMRTIRTDFISCPSCGRTLFDLQQVTARIRARTAHLPGVKIAIMGCIVNGPGEMADADFGYVGSKPGKIDLYVGKKCVERDIDFAEADDRLVALIQAYDRWVEPSGAEV